MFRTIKLGMLVSILCCIDSTTLAQDEEKKSDKEELKWNVYTDKEFEKKRFSAPIALAIMKDL